MTRNSTLWQRLESFDLDDGAPFSFSKRLARDNGWTPEFALRVCDEYKKFLFLACVAGHPVTPSDEVDQAWHLHLTYSRSYWDELCDKVLERPLHHDPTRGGKAEGAKFENWYERTLSSYREIFESQPPPDIWPPSAIRFGEAPHFRRVNLKRHFVLPRPKFSSSNFKVAPAFGLALILAGCSASGSLNPLNWYGSEFLMLFWSLCGLAVLANCGLRVFATRPDDENFPASPLDPYVLARLSHAGNLPVDAALCSLRFQGFIQTDSNGVISRTPNIEPPQHPFEKLVWDQVGRRGRLSGVRAIMKETLCGMDRQLEQAGLVLSPNRKWDIQGAAIASTILLLIIGISKIVVGLQRDRPVGYLTFSCLLVFAVGVAALFSSVPHRTVRGERYLQKLRTATSRLEYFNPGTTAIALVTAAVLWGYSPLEGYGFAEFRRQPPSDSGGSSSSSDSGSSSGDGGGGGGCGGGGCGGCGS